MLVLWVDDILAISPLVSGVNDVRGVLEQRYQLRDMGDLADCLGLQITRDQTHGLLFVNQTKYAKNILYKFHLLNYIPIILPTPSTKILLTSTMISTPK